jgi:hypothetical protein
MFLTVLFTKLTPVKRPPSSKGEGEFKGINFFKDFRERRKLLLLTMKLTAIILYPL